MSGACWCEQQKNDQRVMEDAQIYLLCFFCFVFWHVPCACCETVFMWTERDAKRDALTSVAWKRCRNKCMNIESAQGHAWKKTCEWETLPNLIPCRIHLTCCCVVLLWRNCALKKHEDDTLPEWTKTQIRITICLWSDAVTGTFANSDDAENICVELYVSMRAGIAKHHLCWRYSEAAHCKHAWDGK